MDFHEMCVAVAITNILLFSTTLILLSVLRSLENLGCHKKDPREADMTACFPVLSFMQEVYARGLRNSTTETSNTGGNNRRKRRLLCIFKNVEYSDFQKHSPNLVNLVNE